jgi:hypothetical protein
MSQPLTARQSLEQAIEDFGIQNEGPNLGMGLQQLARASLKDEVRTSVSMRIKSHTASNSSSTVPSWTASILCKSEASACYVALPLQAELIQAADEERRKLKLKKASRQQAAHAAEALFQAPSGFAAFTNKILQVFNV